jgi:hypothetical protein
MGAGRWDDSHFRSYAAATGYVGKSRDEVFSRSLVKGLDPYYIKVRESCDSADNPQSTPIILGLDVTGSMGAIAEQIAKVELPKLMTAILEQQVVTDPHLMFLGIDDVFAQGHGALQASQFEADIRIVEQLRQLWLVGNGGGNGSESYDLAWFFAAHKTVTDCFSKRGKHGFLFTFGDEPAPFEPVPAHLLEVIFGEGNYEKTAPAASLRAAKERYHVFHIVVERGGRVSDALARKTWTDLLGNNAIFLKNPQHLTDVVVATLAIANGADMHTVIRSSPCPAVLEYAFSNSLQAT